MKRNKLIPNFALQHFLIGFIVLSLAASVFLDFRQQKKVRLDRLREDFAFVDLLAAEDAAGLISKDELKKYLQYFQMLVKDNRLSADAYALVGFCQYHLGEKQKARDAYQEALRLNPTFFAFQYDLAVLDFEAGRYQEAFKGFEKALTTNPTDNIISLRKFRNFVYIIYKARAQNSYLNDRLKKGYSLSAYFISVCLEKLGDQKRALFFRQQSQSIADVKYNESPRLRIF